MRHVDGPDIVADVAGKLEAVLIATHERMPKTVDASSKQHEALRSSRERGNLPKPVRSGIIDKR